MSSIPTTGNDRLVGTKASNDTIDGLAGMDVVTYDGKLSEYNFTVNDGVFMVTDARNNGTNNDGHDTLVNIEKVIFQGDKQQISRSNESIANAETGGEQTDTTLLKLPGGGFINFWYGKVTVTENQVDPDTGVETIVETETLGYYFRKFDKNGIASELDKKIIADSDGNMSGFKPAIQSNGDIVIAWSEPDADKNGISVQIFNADGTEKTNSVKFRANDTLTDDQLQPSIAVLSDDSFVVAWTSANQGDSLQHDGVAMGGTPNQAGVFSQHFDSSGNPLGWETKVSESGGSDAFVTALDNGSYVISHEGIEGGTKRMSITASFFDQNDTKQQDLQINLTAESTKSSAPDPIFNELADKQKLPVSAKLIGSDKVIMVWQAPRDAYPTTETHYAHDMNIIARLITPLANNDAQEEFVVTTFTTDTQYTDVTQYDQTQPAVAALANGGFVVVWQSMLQDQSYWGIYGQRFDASGNKVGSEFQVNTKSQDSQQQPSVTALSLADGGGFVVSWEAQYQDGNQQGSSQVGTTATEIVQQRYDANGNPLGNTFAGGTGNDTITITGSGDIEIDGALGNDTLTSGNGNDTLRGNNGNDTLDAGSGNNTVIGGDGVDTLVLAGKQAEYELTGSNGKYLIIGKTGTVYENVHDNLSSVEIIQFSDNQLILSGDQSGGTTGLIVNGVTTDGKLPETLEGSSGDDIITGGNLNAKGDTMVGGDGNDLYKTVTTKSVYMIIYDTGGTDTLRIATNIDLANPLSNKKTLGLEYIENVELTGTSALSLVGNDGNNKLTGNEGANKISGGLGNDTLYGGLGKDTLTGGGGIDRFVFNTTPSAKNVDKITDFTSTDKIDLDSSIFDKLDLNSDGKINADQFLSGAGRKAADVDTAAFLVYDSAAGNLYYDGIGSTSVLIAKVGVYALDANGKMTSSFTPATLTVDNFEIL